MSDTPPADVGAKQRSFTLDFAIVVGGEVKFDAGTTITIRKPMGGELRGLTIAALGQGDYGALETLAPRITSPVLAKPFFAAMDPADVAQFGVEVMDFLLPKSARADFPTA